MSRERGFLVVDAHGTERFVPPRETTIVENKKTVMVDEDAIFLHLMESKRIREEMSVGQREAKVTVQPQYPDMPIFIWLNCDDHLGGNTVDYPSFLRDYRIVRDTPNFFCVSNGDEIDSFMVTHGKVATGVYENPITPEQQARVMRSMFMRLDNSGKVLGMSFGNHNDWIKSSGYTFENTWLRDFSAPILNCGGMIEISLGEQVYKLAMTHKFWGASKLNPTNAAKRYMEHVYPSADILFLGHTHQAEFLYFRRDMEHDYRYAIIGGTYKTNDEWAAQHGLGGRGQLGGMVLKLRPDRKDIEVMKSLPDAQEYFNLLMDIRNEQKIR